MIKPLILGSQSPRRKEILSYFTIPFTQISPLFNEEDVPFMGDPIDYVCSLSKGKAASLYQNYSDSMILTADTIVFLAGKIYNKPKNEPEAFESLSELVGQWHSVFTGVTLRNGDHEFSQWEETRVLFNPLSSEEIRHYQSKIHWADKAGGYAIQMAGGLIVKKIEGCYYNVMGLPINTVRELLQHIGINLWHYVQ